MRSDTYAPSFSGAHLAVGVVALALLAGAAGLSPARAQSGPEATVVPATLNMRYGPGTEYAVIAQVGHGAALTLLARDDVPANGLWLYSRTADGVEGWLLSDYLDIRADLSLDALPVRPAPGDLGTPGEIAAPEAPPAAGGFPEGTGIPAQTSGVNLRTGPGTGYRAITTLAGARRRLPKAATGRWSGSSSP